MNSIKNTEHIILLKSLLIWLLLVILAILNGAFREVITTPLFGEIYARPLSCITLCVLVFVVSLWLLPRIGRGSCKTYLKIGVIWLILTVLFEFSMGFATGTSFREMLRAYDITSGDWWLFVVIFIGITPYLVAKIKRLIS